MKNLRIIIPAGVCAIIGIVAVVMLTKGSGEKVLSKSFVGKTGNTTQTVGKTGNTTVTLHEYVLARMKRGELDLLGDKEKKYFRDAVRVGLIKPPQKDIPPPEPKVPKYNWSFNNGYITKSADINEVSRMVEEDGTHELYKYTTPTDNRFIDGDTRYRVIPKGTLMRKSSEVLASAPFGEFWPQHGHQGMHDMTDGSGRKVADYPYYSPSLFRGGEKENIPLIHKDTTKKELDWLLSGKEPTEEIIKRAEASAIKRMKKGLSPFYAGPGSEKLTLIRPYHP